MVGKKQRDLARLARGNLEGDGILGDESLRSIMASQDLPLLGSEFPPGPVILDTNVFINVLAGREPPSLNELLKTWQNQFISGPTRAELAWIFGRLDPAHPNTARVLSDHAEMVARITPSNVLVPDAAEWADAGELAGRAARVLAGGGRKIATAFDRTELISDALTAILSEREGMTIITDDLDFRVLAELRPGVKVLFYGRGKT